MKNRKLKTWVKIVPIIIVCIAIGIGFLSCHTKQEEDPVVIIEPTQTPEVVPSATPLPDWYITQDNKDRLTQLYQDSIAMNKDVKYILSFQNGLVEEAVVQGQTNDEYLSLDWQTKQYRSWGSAVLDVRNESLDDQNILIYGHYVYPERTPDRTIMFTPLVQLFEEENYEENQYFYLMNDEYICTYQVAYVANVPVEDVPGGQAPIVGLEYNFPDYTEEQLTTLFTNLEDYVSYDTGVKISYGDHWVTMQTCIEGNHYQRQIVIGKQIDQQLIKEN